VGDLKRSPDSLAVAGEDVVIKKGKARGGERNEGKDGEGKKGGSAHPHKFSKVGAYTGIS